MNSSNSDSNNIFNGYHMYIYPVGIGKKRLSLLENQIMNYGGCLAKPENGNFLATHILVEDSIIQDDLSKLKSYLLNNNAKHSEVVQIQWLSKCIREKSCVTTNGYVISLPSREKSKGSLNANGKRPNSVHVLDIASSSTTEESQKDFDHSEKLNYVVEFTPPKKLKQDIVEKFLCSHASRKDKTELNHLIVSELQKLADVYQSSGDKWRFCGYHKAINAIKAYGKEIKSFQEAESIHGVGKKMAMKIQEILELGRLHKVQELCNNEKMQVITLFTKVWGAGASTAEQWYIQGYRTLEDLRRKANLTMQQKIGLKHYNDFQVPIPREEVEQIGAVIHDTALAIKPTLSVMLCGSYRRGKESSGDVDIMITKDDLETDDILNMLVTQLKEIGLITDDLVSLEVNGKQKKYLGVCCLPGENQRHRRLDIFVVPQSEYAPALMHYTGSAFFNRSIRLLASKKGMSLSEHALVAGIVRQGREKLNQGYILSTPTEQSIFEHLGLKFQTPEERNH